MRSFFYVIILQVFAITVSSQENNKSFTVKYITTPIEIDGVLNEPIWEKAEGVQQVFNNIFLQILF